MELVREAKTLVEQFLDVGIPEIPVYVTTEEGLKRELAKLYMKRGYSKEDAEEIAARNVRFLRALYLREEGMILLKEGSGENLQTLVHEFLHIVQKCDGSPLRREKIVIFLTYRMLQDKFEHDLLTRAVVEEWEAKERSVGLERIKQRLLEEGDCNDL